MSISIHASASDLKSVHINNQTINFSFSQPVKYKTFALSSPHRVVLDILEAKGDFKLKGKQASFIKKVRHAQHDGNLRVVFDVTKATDTQVTLRGRNLILSLRPKNVTKTKAPIKKATKSPSILAKKVVKPTKSRPNRVIKKAVQIPQRLPIRKRRGEFVVAIDAGHGGKDSGAVGSHGTYEKTVVLQIAKRLKAKIDKAPNMRGVLIRSGDYYIPLRERMKIARKNHANLFISIHADANPNKYLTGSSVYILSEKGASSEAALWLASNENRYEKKLSGTQLNSKDSTLATMLMDLAQAATIDNSLSLAKNTLSELGQVTKLLRHQVESAAFVVLKSPDIPSMLIETAFITNPSEEKKLKTRYYQSKLANAIFNGIQRFKVAHHPSGNNLQMFATNDVIINSTHTVKSGESLSAIALKYGISQTSLRRKNKLRSSFIRAGQELTIPTSS